MCKPAAFLLGTLLTALVIAADTNNPLVVVVHLSNRIESLNPADLRRIYTGQDERWQDGQKISVVDHPPDSESHKEFYRAIFGQDAAPKFIRLDSPAPFRPTVRKSDKAILELVSRFPNAIGYMRASAVDDRVRVFSIAGSRPDEKTSARK